jgi:hypothetical protein
MYFIPRRKHNFFHYEDQPVGILREMIDVYKSEKYITCNTRLQGKAMANYP